MEEFTDTFVVKIASFVLYSVHYYENRSVCVKIGEKLFYRHKDQT